MRRSLLLLALWLPACRQAGENTMSTRINALYNAVGRNRYGINDSLKYYVDWMEREASGRPAVYRAMAAIAKGSYYSRLSDYAASLEQYQRAQLLLKGSGIDSLLGKAQNGIGNAYKNTGQYPLAIAAFQQALAHFERMPWPEGIAGVNSNLAQTYQVKGDSAAAWRHLQQGLDALAGNRQSKAYLHLLHLKANAHLYGGEPDSALRLDAEGIALASVMNMPLFLSPFLDNKAGCFARLGRIDSALANYRRSLAIDSAAGSTKQVADTYLNLGRLEAKNGGSQNAEAHFLHAIRLSQEAAYRQGERDAWRELGRLYEERRNFAQAVAANTRFAAVNDSLINEQTEKRIAELQAGFDNDKKEQQLQLQAVQLSRQKLVLLAVVAAALGTLLAGYAFYRRRQLVRAAEMQAALLQQKQEAILQILTAEEKERQRIATDLHDGLGQMMTAAWLNLQALDKQLAGGEQAGLLKKTTALVGDSCTEIRQVSHNMMPNALQRKGLVAAVRGFTGQLDEKLLRVHLQAPGEGLRLSPTGELILYRVIQECVNNVIRHAQATELYITINKEKDGIDILIEDNGLGFDTAQVSKGLGMQNIRSRIQYLGGTVEWDNTGSGTVVAIFIPYQHG